MIYSYFGSKDGLFAAVYDAQVVLTIDAVPFDAEDLPNYAARQFDHQLHNPTVHRLTAWARLERGADAPPIEAITASNARKIAAIEAAQASGHLPQRYSPQELLGLVRAISGMWNGTAPDYCTDGSVDTARQRQTIIDAVRLLIQ